MRTPPPDDSGSRSDPGVRPGTALAVWPGSSTELAATGRGRHSSQPGRDGNTDPSGGGRPVTTRVLLAVGLVLLLAAGVFAVSQLVSGRGVGTGAQPSQIVSRPAQPSGTGQPSATGPAAVPSVVSRCPASSVPGAGAGCPTQPECWNGIVTTAGSAVAESVPCTGPHVWETFALGNLPGTVHTYDQSVVAADPTVSAVCSMKVMLKSRRDAAQSIPASKWTIDVLPPESAAYASGARGYRCLASVEPATGIEPKTSQFGA